MSMLKSVPTKGLFGFLTPNKLRSPPERVVSIFFINSISIYWPSIVIGLSKVKPIFTKASCFSIFSVEFIKLTEVGMSSF